MYRSPSTPSLTVVNSPTQVRLLQKPMQALLENPQPHNTFPGELFSQKVVATGSCQDQFGLFEPRRTPCQCWLPGYQWTVSQHYCAIIDIL